METYIASAIGYVAQLHLYHLQTSGHAHTELQSLYTGLQDKIDAFAEQVLAVTDIDEDFEIELSFRKTSLEEIQSEVQEFLEYSLETMEEVGTESLRAILTDIETLLTQFLYKTKDL